MTWFTVVDTMFVNGYLSQLQVTCKRVNSAMCYITSVSRCTNGT